MPDNMIVTEISNNTVVTNNIFVTNNIVVTDGHTP